MMLTAKGEGIPNRRERVNSCGSEQNFIKWKLQSSSIARKAYGNYGETSPKI